MNVLIAGGGRTGARLANLLLNQNYKVCIVENRRELLGYLHQELPTDNILFNEFHALLVEVGKRWCKRRQRPIRMD